MSMQSRIIPAEWPPSWPPYGSVVRLARGIAGRHGDYESLAHVAIERGLRSRAHRSVLGLGWFATVMRNAKRDRYRRSGPVATAPIHEVGAEAMLASADPTPEEQSMSRESVQRLLGAVGALPERPRTMVTRRYLDGLTVQQVAQEMALSHSTVERECRRALDGLARDLGRGASGARSGALSLGVAGVGGRWGFPSGLWSRWTSGSKAASVALLVVALPLLVVALTSSFGGGPAGAAAGTPGRMSIDETGREVAAVGAPIQGAAMPARDRAQPAPGMAAVAQPVNAELLVSPTPPADPATHTFSIELQVNGQPVGTEWRVRTPLFEPDAPEAASDEHPRCRSFDREPTSGRFDFELPGDGGVWLFRFVNDATGTVVWLKDEGRTGAPRSVAFDTAPFEFERPSHGPLAVLEADEHAVYCHMGPGCWVAAPIRAGEGAEDQLAIKAAAVGANYFVRVNGVHDPDAWVRIGEDPVSVIWTSGD